jgi:DNA-directed RNA polymerase specialized sigma subunit
MKLTIEQRELVEDNVKLAYYHANRHVQTTPFSIDDCVSLCFETLVVASQRYRNLNGASFSTYFAKCIDYAFWREKKKYNSNIGVQYFEELGTEPEDIAPPKAPAFNRIAPILRSWKGTQREKAAAITYIRNPDLLQSEIALMTGVSQKTVSTGIAKLKEQLQEQLAI